MALAFNYFSFYTTCPSRLMPHSVSSLSCGLSQPRSFQRFRLNAMLFVPAQSANRSSKNFLLRFFILLEISLLDGAVLRPALPQRSAVVHHFAQTSHVRRRNLAQAARVQDPFAGCFVLDGLLVLSLVAGHAVYPHPLQLRLTSSG